METAQGLLPTSAIDEVFTRYERVCADEWTYLKLYFGQRPDEYQRARFFLTRQVAHMLSAAVFLMLGSAGKPVSKSENPHIPRVSRVRLLLPGPATA